MTKPDPIETLPSETVIVIEEVHRDRSAVETLSNFSIDHPKLNHKYPGFLLEIAGWVVGRDSPVNEVIIGDNLSKFASIPVAVPRNDVSAAFPALNYPIVCGFNAVLPVTGLPREFRLNFVANTELEQRIPFGHIIGRRTPVSLPNNTGNRGLQPLLVTTLGRTGSSWLMHLLLQHPDITGYRKWGYEFKGSSYWLRTFRSIIEHPHGLDRPSAYSNDPESWWGLVNPFGSKAFHNWWKNDSVINAADFCRDGIRSVYSKIADIQNQPSAKYFAEKMLPNWQLSLLRELFATYREIILVRDFRDMVASILSFNHKRGFKAFNQSLAKTEEEYPFVLKRGVMNLVDEARKNPSALVVKYEDLVIQPTTTLTTIFAHLGLTQDDAAIEEMVRKALETTPDMEYHKTSSSIQDSVGRWRIELSNSVAAACNDAFKDALAEFKYIEEE